MTRDTSNAGPFHPGYEADKKFHESCRNLVSRSWRDDGHVGIVTIFDGATRLNITCPAEPAHWANAPCKDGHGYCVVKHYTEEYGDPSEFLHCGMIVTTVNGPVPLVWDANLHMMDDPETVIAPKAAIQYAANVSAMEFGKDSVKFDWWIDPTRTGGPE